MRDTSPAGGTGAARAQQAPGADDGRSGFGAFAARYQPENFSGEDTGWRDWSWVFRIWAGRFQRRRVQEITRAVEARPGDEECCSRFLSRTDSLPQRESAVNCLDQQRGRVNKYGPTSTASVVGKLADYAHAV